MGEIAEEKVCSNCRYWVGFDSKLFGNLVRGQCTAESVGVGFKIVGKSDETHLTTPFDWSCAGHEPNPPSEGGELCLRSTS